MRTSRLSVSRERDGTTLTPQRKHRKLLKDGSSEVWPEEIERIFVQGWYPTILLSSLSHPPPLRSSRILGITLGHLLSWQKSLEKPILGRIFTARWNRPFQKAGCKSHTSTSQYVERRTRSENFIERLIIV